MEKLGTATLALLRDWLQRLSGVTVRPVLDLARPTRSTPTTHRAGCASWSMLRDRHCVFPGCTVDARACDLDHIDPYVPPDEGGPPGQTTPRTWPACAGDTTGPRPSPAGPTDDSPTTHPRMTRPRTSGPAHSSAPTASPPDPAEPAARKSV